MSGEFVDTNVLVYAHDTTAGRKREVAAGLLGRLSEERAGQTSVQVLSELYVTLTRKLPNPLPSEAAEEIVADFATWRWFSPRPFDVIETIRISRRYQISFWDAMIVRGAATLEAQVIWSEDLNPGQAYEGIAVRNPFTG
jgi:predicted nucleic acid-binding protein